MSLATFCLDTLPGGQALPLSCSHLSPHEFTNGSPGIFSLGTDMRFCITRLFNMVLPAYL